MSEYIQLPNGDLWRGYKDAPTALALSEVEKVNEDMADPVNRAMAAILHTARGSRELSCIWCGQQGDEKSTRAHIKAVHASAIGLDKASDAQVLSAQLATTKQELAQERAKE